MATYYSKFLQVSEYLKSILGLPILDLDTSREVMLPYQVSSIEYLNEKLIELGTEDLKTLVEKVFEVYSTGADHICGKEALVWAGEIGVSDFPDYDQDVFVFSWSNFMSTLCLRLKFQYPDLFIQDDDGSDCCNCNCGKGDTISDFESWRSGVYPEDEQYDRSNYLRTTTAWGVEKDRFCGCYKVEDGE